MITQATTVKRIVRISLQQVGVGVSNLPYKIVRLGDSKLRVVQIGKQGLQGRPGSDGAGSNLSDSLEVIDPSIKNFTLTQSPNIGSLRVYLNGIRERNSSFTIIDQTVHFTPLDLGVGDQITFDYTYGE